MPELAQRKEQLLSLQDVNEHRRRVRNTFKGTSNVSTFASNFDVASSWQHYMRFKTETEQAWHQRNVLSLSWSNL